MAVPPAGAVPPIVVSLPTIKLKSITRKSASLAVIVCAGALLFDVVVADIAIPVVTIKITPTIAIHTNVDPYLDSISPTFALFIFPS